MNSDVAHSFKELLMGYSVKLDDVYYDKEIMKYLHENWLLNI